MVRSLSMPAGPALVPRKLPVPFRQHFLPPLAQRALPGLPATAGPPDAPPTPGSDPRKPRRRCRDASLGILRKERTVGTPGASLGTRTPSSSSPCTTADSSEELAPHTSRQPCLAERSKRWQKTVLMLGSSDLPDALEGAPVMAWDAASSASTDTPLSSVSTSSPPSANAAACFGQNWIRGKTLGSGSFGTVYKALDRETMQLCAVKESILEEDSLKCKDRLDSELTICQNLRHANIVRYLGHEYSNGHLRIYLEYCAGGSMAAVLSEFGPLSPIALRKATQGTLEGLNYLHTRSPPVLHRDIKGANVLMDLHFNVKLADFGCSKCSSDTKSFSTVGTIPWMAPEVIDQKDGSGRKADIWSFGCLVIEMATAEKPWGNNAFGNIMFALNQIANSGLTPPVPADASGSCQELIRNCTRRDPAQRPSTTELLAHEYLRGKGSKEEVGPQRQQPHQAAAR